MVQTGKKSGRNTCTANGGGKSFVATRFLCHHPLSDGYRILWLAHTQYLLEQALKSFDKTIPLVDKTKMPIRVRVVSGAARHFKPAHIKNDEHVLICTLQTAVGAFKNEQTRFAKFIKEANKGAGLFVIFDEAHHAPAPTYRKLLNNLKDNCKPFGLLGLTATPVYSDERKQGWLKNIFPDGIIAETDARDLMVSGVLAKPIAEEVSTNIESEFDEQEYQKLNSIYRDLPPDIIEGLAKNNTRNNLIVKHYVENKKKYGKTIMFADRWYQCEYLLKALQKRGVLADAVYSQVKDRSSARDRTDKNAKAIQEFKDGKLDVLINVQMLTEGVDVPDTQTVFLTRQTTSETLLRQMVGRALRGRKFGGTKEAYIVSFIDNWKHAINWATYNQIMGGMTDSDEPGPKLRAPLQLVSIALVRQLAQQMDSGNSMGSAPYNTHIPIGWYNIRYDAVVNRDDDIEVVHKFVLVYDQHEEHFKQFIDKLLDLKLHDGLQNFDLPSLDTETANNTIKIWLEEFFGNDRFGVTTTDLLHLARHVAQDNEPDFVKFEQRDNHNLDDIAEDYIQRDLGLRKVDELLREEFNRSDRLWKQMYSDMYNQFKFEFNSCVGRILHKNAYSPKKEYKTPESIEELDDKTKLMIKKRDKYRCLSCGSKNRKWLEVDHIVPRYYTVNHSHENLQTLCNRCNRQKGTMEIDFRKEQTGLGSVPHEFPDIPMPEGEDARYREKWELYLRCSVNFFYRCAAVKEIYIPPEHALLNWEVVLHSGIDPKWIRPYLKKIIKKIQRVRGDAGIKVGSMNKPTLIVT